MYRVLIVDDNPDFCSTLKGLLSDEGYVVETAANEEEAIEAVTREPFDFALVDVRLHDGGAEDESGLSLAMALRALSSRTRVILLTRYVSTRQVVRAVRYCGAVDFLDKTSDIGAQVLQVLAAVQKKKEKAEPLNFELPGGATRLSLSLAEGQPLTIRARGHHVCSLRSSKMPDLSLDQYARRTEIARKAGDNRFFQIKEIGGDLWRDVFVDNGEVKDAFLVAQAGSQALSVSFEAPGEFLRLPLEFTRPRASECLVLRHPLSRFVCGAIPRREPISPSLLASTDRLRVLIIASNTEPAIDGVDAESQELYKYLQGQDCIPVSVTLLPTEQATRGRVEAEFRNEYDVIHYAGHGSHVPGSPGDSSVYFWAGENKQGDVVPMTANELMILLGDSRPRLVYLSCCDGTATGGKAVLLDDDFLGVADAIVQAGVPTVLGYRWPVSDSGAPRLALAFYRALLEEARGSPEVALWRARRELAGNRKDSTWLSPILIHQV